LVGSAGEAGFTLAEILGVIAAISVMTAISSLTLGTLSTKFSLDGSARTVAMALNQGRVYAITRAHVVSVAFTSGTFTTTDTQASGGAAKLAGGALPSPLTVSGSSVVSFSPLGTVSTPFVATLTRGGNTRIVRVEVTGEVDIQ
jgi:Tfp pilus assembly protein FimT